MVETESCSGLTTEGGNPGVSLADEIPMDDKYNRKNHDSLKVVAAIGGSFFCIWRSREEY